MPAVTRTQSLDKHIKSEDIKFKCEQTFLLFIDIQATIPV